MMFDLSQLSFGVPGWLWGLLLLPLLAMLFVWADRRAAGRLARLIRDPRLRGQLTGAASAARRRWRYGLLLAGLGCLFVALAGPRLGYVTIEVHRRGLDVIVIADVSKSMLATDLSPDRLTRAKLAIQDLVTQLAGDRVGLVPFAGDAFLMTPLTLDYDAVLAATQELDVDLIPTGGTDIGGAIDTALEAFGKASTGNRAIVLLSDGEPTVETEQAAGIQAAKRAADAGVRIFTVGFGTPEGSMIPVAHGRRGEFVRDENGQIVRTKLNEPGLTEIAKTANGFYTRFSSGDAAMRTVIQDGLSKLRAGDIDSKTDRRPIERYQWPLGAGLLLLALASIPGERRRYRALAGAGGATPGARAVPVRRVGAGAIVAILGLAIASGLRAEEAIPLDPPAAGASDGPLALYRQGKYDEAYRAFSELAKAHPEQGNLQFDAGASAYMSKQWDESLEAFGQALAAPDASLRAKAHYNFGNALFRRGQTQPDKPAKIRDWRNAIQHYDSTLDALRHQAIDDPGHALAENTAFNRALVQRRVDEELKEQPKPSPTPPPSPSPSPSPNDKKDQNQQQQNQQDKSDQQKSDQQSQDPQSGQDQNQQPQPQQSQDKGGSSRSPDQGGSGESKQKQDGSSNQPPKPDSQQAQPSPGSSPAPGGQPTPDQQQGGHKPKEGQRNPGNGTNNPQPGQQGTPDQKSVPNQDQQRQRGDFHSQPEQKKDPNAPPDKKGEGGVIAEKPAQDEPGKMSAAQAMQLLDSLKNEDAQVMLNNRHRNRDDSPAKDW